MKFSDQQFADIARSLPTHPETQQCTCIRLLRENKARDDVNIGTTSEDKPQAEQKIRMPSSKSAKITFITPDKSDDKDHDTLVNFMLTTKEGNEWKKHVAGKSSIGAGIVFKDPSEHSLDLECSDITRAGINGLEARIGIQPVGNDTWFFSFKLVLTFADDSKLEAASGVLKISEKIPVMVFELSEAKP